jgi:predicted nuclease of predicted toxin-antitoxin system
VAPRFLIDENLSPQLAHHLRAVHGYEAVHVNEIGLQGGSDADVLARAVAEDRIVVTSNAEDFRQLGRRTPDHPGLAVLRDAVGLAQQLVLGVKLATAIDAAEIARGHLFEIDRHGIVRAFKLP